MTPICPVFITGKSLVKKYLIFLLIDNAQGTGTPLQQGQDDNAMTAVNEDDDDNFPPRKE